MAEYAARGKMLIQESKYEEAIEAYTAALKSAPTSPVYLIQRSTAYQRAKKYPEALADAEAAVANAVTRAKRELILDAQLRRGIALYQLGRYGDAKFVLDIVNRMDEKNSQGKMYAKMNEGKLAALGEGDEKANVTVEEVPKADAAAVASSSPALAKGAVGSSGVIGSNGTAKPVQPAPVQQTPIDKIRHDWYQNNENVYFTLLAKGVPKDKAQVDIQERSLSISFPVSTSDSIYDFTLDPLFAAVLPDKSTVRVLTTKLEIVLAKTVPGQKWSKLESSEPVVSSTNSTANVDGTQDDIAQRAVSNAAKVTGPAYPTSSKHGPKDWDKITADLGKSSDAKPGSAGDDDEYEGGDEANHFFKKLFKDSSPEVQRAMMKSYTESNGTALSTNWDEVSKAKVETTPPDGMEARKWG